ncbi:MAG: EAL domain-containing protein [Gammaproteobacteria bacterium]|nr:EAL domain-containing protein [Gammaproteobacteria bacterium]
MHSSEQELQSQIIADRVKLLYGGTWASVFTQLLVAAIFVTIQVMQSQQESLALWYGALAILLLSRGLLERRFAERNVEARDLSAWLWRYRFGVLLTGMVFGSASLLFYPQDAVAYQVFTVLLLAGLAAGALVVLVSDFSSYVIYSSCLLIPAIGVSAASGDQLHFGIALLVTTFYLLLIRSSHRMNRLVTSSLRLRYENRALLGNLEKEKNRLDNRLGRILNDSSNEIYVLDAESLKCLQVNVGAIQNLGYSQDELVDKGLPDILVDFKREEFDSLVQPLFEATLESVFYSGAHQRKDGGRYEIEARMQLSTEEEPPVFVATVLDISDRKESERKLIQQANFDQLTALPNRYYMLSRIDSAFARAKREKRKVALLFMDLDNFKTINDTLGHKVGDELLKHAANRIRSVLRDSDTPARLGGDEFLVMLEGLESTEHAEVVARKLVSCFKHPFDVNAREVYTTTSIGISVYPDDGESVDLLMQHADTAMYQAKMGGRSHYRYFSLSMRQATEEQMLMEAHLRRAMGNDELYLDYQPKIDILTGQIVGAEALVRWNSIALGKVSPNVFIKLAENIGLIESLGEWVMRTACKEAKKWQALRAEPIHVAVNVSSHQFRVGRLLEEVDRILLTTGLAAEALELEITESLLVQDTSEPLQILQALHARNIKLALDDFGTGYSSLSYLKRFPLKVLKIDRSFIRDLGVDQSDEALVEAIVAMAQSLRLEVVAEGVENMEQLEFLRQRDVRLVQGYLFSPPVSADTFLAMLKSDTSWGDRGLAVRVS